MDELDQRPGELDVDHVEVRVLGEADLEWVVRIDAQRSGRVRRPYYKLMLEEAVHHTGLRISLAAFVAHEPAGFLMARLYYGEFGQLERAAVLDSIGIAPAFAGRKVGRALLRQLEMNLAALGVERLENRGRLEHVRARRILPTRRLPARRAVVSRKDRRTSAMIENRGAQRSSRPITRSPETVSRARVTQ